MGNATTSYTILFVVIGIAVIIYLNFFKDNKKLFLQQDINRIFDEIDAFLLPLENDSPHIIAAKEGLASSTNKLRILYVRVPSKYEEIEINELVSLPSRTWEKLREVSHTLENKIRPLCIEALEANKNLLKTSTEAMKSLDDGSEKDDDFEDSLDTIEKIIEETKVSIKEDEKKLMEIETSIQRYRSPYTNQSQGLKVF